MTYIYTFRHSYYSKVICTLSIISVSVTKKACALCIRQMKMNFTLHKGEHETKFHCALLMQTIYAIHHYVIMLNTGYDWTRIYIQGFCV